MGEELVIKGVARNWNIITTSKYVNRYRRLLDIVITIVQNRMLIEIAYIEVYSGLAFIWAEISVYLLSILNKKIIITLHGGMLPEFAKRWPGRVRRLLKTSTVITTPSYYLQESLGNLSQNILYLPNGLEIENYQYKERREISPKLIWLRAFHQIYNPLLAVQVVEELKHTYKDIHLLMVGPDKKDGSLADVKSEIENKNLGENIEIIGAIAKAEVPKYLNMADVFINTTRYESFGVSVMEAGAAGLPIVSTIAGEIPYIWIDEENALLVHDDVKEMSIAIERIFSEPELALRLSKNARINAEIYAWENILSQWDQLLSGSVI